jgi:alkylation response protein AidB-like acyl-CoA dehydrogenase
MRMDFSWSEEQASMRRSIVEFAKADLNEGYQEREKRGEFNRQGWKRCAEMGIHGLPVPVEYGGTARDALTTVGLLESLGYGCVDNGLVFSINAHMWTLEIPLLHFGTDEQKERFLPRLSTGEIIGANAMSEPGAGSDAYSLETTAEKRGDRYVLNGSKVFVTNGSVADIFIVYATVDRALGPNGVSAFLVERGSSGLSFGKPMQKMGLKTSPMCELFFDNCEVPEENRLGREGAGKNLFADSMTWERSCILASGVGAMERLLDLCVRHAKQHRESGQPIGKNQMIASKIVGMKMRLETSRSLLYRAGWLSSKGKSIYLEAALAKLHISESWVETARDAVQIFGEYGYTREYGIERELRDAVASRLYSGTSEIQRLIIASLLGL